MSRKLFRNYRYAGVYKIENKHNGKVYIGSSENVEKRMADHLSNLLHGTHHCKEMQKDFDDKHRMVTDVLYVEVVHNHRPLDWNAKIRLHCMERKFMEEYNSIENGYNKLHIGRGISEDHVRSVFASASHI